MRAAGLKAIATVVDSTAVLIRSKHPSDPKLVNIIAQRIKGVITAQKYVLCSYNVDRKNLEKVSKITPGKRAPTLIRRPDRSPQQVRELQHCLRALGDTLAVDASTRKIETTQAEFELYTLQR